MNASNTDPYIFNIIIGLGQGAALLLIAAAVIAVVAFAGRVLRWAFPKAADTTSATPLPADLSPELKAAFAKLDEQQAEIDAIHGQTVHLGDGTTITYREMIRRIHAVPVAEYDHFDYATGEAVRKGAVAR